MNTVQFHFSRSVLALSVIIAAIGLLAVWPGPTTAAADKPNLEIESLRHNLRAVSSDIEVLRRDQINYRIEKDLLKEAYSSNLQTVQLLLSIGLGLMGILGYLGIRNIKEVKKDYDNELEKLRKLKDEFEDELKNLRNRQSQAESKVDVLSKTNEEQNRKIQILELIERIGGIIRDRNWDWALNWLSSALELDPENPIFLKQKVHCLLKLGRFGDAEMAIQKLVALEPENASNILNLLEIFALSARVVEFNDLYARNRELVNNKHDGHAINFLNGLLAITSTDPIAAKTSLSTSLSKYRDTGDTKQALLGNWSMEEARAIADKCDDPEKRRLIRLIASFFEGQVSFNEFISALNSETKEEVT